MKSTDLNRLQKEVCNNPFYHKKFCLLYRRVFVVNGGGQRDRKTKCCCWGVNHKKALARKR